MNSAYYEDEQQDDISSGKALRRLLPLLKPHLRWLIFCFALLATSKVVYLAGPELVRRAIDVNIKGADYSGLLVTVAFYIVTQVLFLGINYVFRIRMEIIGQNVMTGLRTRLFDHIVGRSISFFDRHPVGRLMARVESDSEALRQLFTNTVVTMIGSLVLLVGMFIWMLIVSPLLTAVVAAHLPFMFAGLYLFNRITTPKWLVIRKRMADVTASLTEFIQGVEIIQIFHRGADVRRRMNEANRAKYRPQVSAEIMVIGFFDLVFFLQNLIIALVIYAGARWAGQGEITIGMLVMFVSYVRMFFEPLMMAAEEIAVVQKAIAGARRIYALMETKESIPEPVRPVVWPNLRDGITFEDVSFSYRDDDTYAVRNISFHIQKGRRFALAGVTGGGKTTISSLLLRFYDPQKGRILVDGIDIRDITISDLRAKIGLVLQDIVLFPGTVATNVGLSANGSDRTRIVDACRLVAADRFIDRMPKGYDTELSERGANLSRGERQLLSFARALAFDPAILILDEATSSVDPETERLIQDGLTVLLQNRTSIVIAHRLSTILNVDQILVFREGEIVERGSHTELLEQNGYYAKLFKLQFKSANGVGVQLS